MQLHRSDEPMPPDDMWIKGLGTTLWTQFGQITDDKEEIERMVQTYRTYNLTHHDALVKPYDGVVDEILRLKDRGKRLGLVTSKLRDGAMRGLRVSALDQAFDIVIGCDDVAHTKPHPEPVRKAVEELGVTCDETVFIGDSRHDMECGRAAGARRAPRLQPIQRHRLAARAHRRSVSRRIARPDPRHDRQLGSELRHLLAAARDSRQSRRDDAELHADVGTDAELRRGGQAVPAPGKSRLGAVR